MNIRHLIKFFFSPIIAVLLVLTHSNVSLGQIVRGLPGMGFTVQYCCPKDGYTNGCVGNLDCNGNPYTLVMDGVRITPDFGYCTVDKDCSTSLTTGTPQPPRAKVYEYKDGCCMYTSTKAPACDPDCTLCGMVNNPIPLSADACIPIATPTPTPGTVMGPGSNTSTSTSTTTSTSTSTSLGNVSAVSAINNSDAITAGNSATTFNDGTFVLSPATQGHCLNGTTAVACSNCGSLAGCIAPNDPGPAPKAVQWNPSYHSCTTKSGTIIPASPVSKRVSGDASDGSKFDNTVNARQACCLNSSNGLMPSYDKLWEAPPDGKNTAGKHYEKYDCFDNTKAADGKPYANFDQLWASLSGNQNVDLLPNAIILRNTLGNVISGFYTKNGRHCDKFSELGGTNAIQPGQVNPIVTKNITMNKVKNASGERVDSVSFVPSGTPIPRPILPPQFLAHPDKFPGPPDCKSRPHDCLECPILIRAAIQVKCGDNNKNNSNFLTTYIDKDGGAHCGTASTMMVHISAQQVYKISGEQTMPPTDTVIGSGRAATFDVRSLIQPNR